MRRSKHSSPTSPNSPTRRFPFACFLLPPPALCQGERSFLHIPAAEAYGDFGFGDKVPPGSDLVFEIELLRINAKTASPEIYDEKGTMKAPRKGGCVVS